MLRSSLLLLLLLLLLAAACERGAARDAAIETGPADTAAAIQPRTPAEIEQQSEAMTPERAAELGVVDTTIQVTDEP
jgi:hypothetical protein